MDLMGTVRPIKIRSNSNTLQIQQVVQHFLGFPASVQITNNVDVIQFVVNIAKTNTSFAL